MKPDTKLPGHLERCQGLGMVSFILVSRFVADRPEVVKQIADFQRDHSVKLQSPQEIGL